MPRVLPESVILIEDTRSLNCEVPMAMPFAVAPAADTRAVTLATNETIEKKIRAESESWLWLHRRWPPGSPLRGV